MKVGAPVIGLNDSGGARIQEGVESLAGYADIFLRNTLASGVVPQISAIMGPCAGGAVYSPAITDFILMVEGTSYMFITGPDVIKAVTHEEVDEGGPRRRARRTRRRAASATSRRPTTRRCIAQVRELLSFLPSNNTEDPPFKPTTDPRDARGARARHDGPARVEQALRHEGRHPRRRRRRALLRDRRGATRRTSWSASRASAGAPSASSPTSRRCSPACLDIDASMKAARFVRFCDCFNIPLVTFVDVPGFLPGTDQEYGGIIKHGAKLLYAFAEATVPKVTVITRKAYGGAYDVMASQAHPRRHQLRVPHRRDRGHGPRRRGQHRLPQRDRQGGRSRRRRAPSSSPTTARSSPTRTRRPSSASSTR